MSEERIVLGEGYPWAYGLGPIYKSIGVNLYAKGVAPIGLDWPKELWREDVGRYRLVLEKVEEDAK